MKAADVLDVLTALPPALLITGPGSLITGRRVFDRHSQAGGMQVSPVTADAARDIQVQAHRRLPVGLYRVFLAGLDGSSEAALNALLKVLEEPPATARFILTSVHPTLETIVSRCHVLALGRTADPEGADPRVRSAVSTAIKAARAATPGLLSMTLRGWDPACTAGLSAWAAEAASGRWRAYDSSFAPGVTQDEALQVLILLRTYRGARTAPAVALTRAFSPG